MATQKAPAKVAAHAPKSPAMSSGMMAPESPWKWVYVAGVLVAGLANAFNFTALDPYLGWLLLAAGLLVGFLYFDPMDVQNFGLRYLILLAVAGASATFLAPAGTIGGYISGFFGGFASFLGPVVLAQVIMAFYWKYFG